MSTRAKPYCWYLHPTTTTRVTTSEIILNIRNTSGFTNLTHRRVNRQSTNELLRHLTHIIRLFLGPSFSVFETFHGWTGVGMLKYSIA